MNDNFFGTLPSDNAAKCYPNNTDARFLTKLLETIRLQEQYKMALVKIIYLHNWYNVHDKKDNYWIAATKNVAMQKAYLPPGYYGDATALIESFGFAQDTGAKFSFNRATGRLSLNFHLIGSYTLCWNASKSFW